MTPILSTLLVSAAHPQSSTKVETLAFMAGSWARTTDGMHVEQVFLPPVGGTMVGMQRRTQGDSTLVSYFFIIEETENGIVCRFKHFENDYMTYEDRNNTGPRTFWLREAAGTAVIFEERTPSGPLYLRYRMTDAGKLGIAVGSPEDFSAEIVVESLHHRVP